MSKPARKLSPTLKEGLPIKKEVLAAANDTKVEQVDDAEFEEELQKLKEDPRLKLFPDTLRMFRAFKVGFRNALPENPKIFVLDTHRHAEIQWVFKGSEVTFLEKTYSGARDLQTLGLEAEKRNPEKQSLPEDAEILVALDENTRARRRFVKNIADGGWLLCRANMAANLLQSSNKFKCMGTLIEGSGQQHLEKSRREDYWEYTVENDDEWKAASQDDGASEEDGFVTYEEAVKALRETGRATGEASGNVLENYRRLLEEARGTNENEGDEETISYKSDSMKQALELRCILPLNHEHRDRIFILKKKANV